MDRPITESQQRKTNAKGAVRWIILAAALVGGLFLVRQFLKTSIDTKDFRVVKVQKGLMENTITASGLIVPTFEQQVNAPITSEIETVYLTSGANVKTGDLILELNGAFARLEYESTSDQLELRKNNVTKLKLEYEKNLQELDYEDQIKALQLSSLEADVADKKRLVAIGGATEEELEQAELNLKIEQLQKKKLENDLNFRKKSIKSDQRNLELEVMIQEKKLSELATKLNQTKVTAPRQGVVTWVQENIGQKVNEGDPLVRLANLDAFRIEASCSDRYANKVNLGGPVRVRVNRENLNGTITSILPAVENNTIAFIVELAQKDHPALRPDMRVDVFIISDRKDNVLRVDNGPAFKGGIQQPIFVVNGDQAVKRKIRIGLTNADYVEIESGLKEGDRIIISDMEDYDHLETIEMKN